MQIPFRNKDVYSGLAMVLLGAFAADVGKTYDIGTVNNMGPGFVPTWLGIILVGVGFLIMLTALISREGNVHADWQFPDIRGSACILAGLVAFIIGARYFGLVAGSLALIFISAMGDKEQTLKRASILAVAVTAFGVVVFFYTLHLPFPLFAGSE